MKWQAQLAHILFIILSDYNCFMSVVYFVHFQGTMCSDYNYEIPTIVFAVT